MYKINKKVKIISIVIIALFVTLLVSTVYVGYSLKHPFKITNNKEFEVKKGDTFYSIITRLNSQGVMTNPLIVKAYIKYYKIPGIIKPGIYMLSSDISLKEFIHNVGAGTFDENYVKVTIPEGYNLSQIADKLQSQGILSKDNFIKACESYKLPSYVKDDNKRRYKLEGYLFPDTYELKKGMSGNDVIKLMLNSFKDHMNLLAKNDNITIDEDKYDSIVDMASVIEMEAYKDEDRATIASVFYNRISKNMKLQSNVTVEYALGYHKEKLYNKDTAIASPYNTYYVTGLPEGPICSPGIKSLRAAAEPSKTNYIYFLSYDNGVSYFTADYNKFLAEKKKLQGN
ncbi:endolytic transglycosylase MltG [Clostridium akagii]|uniref:endolytic transglycosylase MltG n=1 Tax=Clostridium akagii TaxID=91623 RepID=UPI00055E1C1A|nr:endolytic transglycosylase MltG [Clostridium akagii]